MQTMAQRRPPPDKPYKCMTRSTLTEYCYTLHSFADFTFSPLQLYLLHFPSCFTKAYEAQLHKANSNYMERESTETVIERNLSIFFKTFCRHVVLHSLLLQEQKSAVWYITLANEMMGVCGSSEREMGNVTRKLVQEACVEYDCFWGGNRSRSSGQAAAILEEMQINIDNLIKEVQRDPQQILKNQYFPIAEANPEMLSLYVRRNFERIANVHVLRRERKRQMLEMLILEYGGAFSMRIPWLKDKTLQNKIYMARNTNDKEPVLTLLPTYLRSIGLASAEVKLALMESVILLFSQFYRQTKHFFPHLKLKSILFNQKSLQPVYEQGQIILDALGYAGNTNTIEQDVAFGATPSQLDQEKSYLEYDKQVQWILNRKYYGQKRNQNSLDDEESGIDELLILDGKKLREGTVLEHIHVWRLLCVVYSILNVKSEAPQALAFKIYADEYGSIPFFRSHFIKALKKTQEALTFGQTGLRKLLNLMPNRDQLVPQPFDFTLGELKAYFNIQEEDSLLQDLKFHSIHKQLLLRANYVDKLEGLLLNYFKKMLNPKKYIIIYFFLASQNLYKAILSSELEQKCQGSRRKLITQAAKHSGRTKHAQQLPTVQEKLKQYKTRKDDRYAFIRELNEATDAIKNLDLILERINKLEQQLNTCEGGLKLASREVEAHKAYAALLEEEKRLGVDGFNLCMRSLKSFTQAHICNQIERLEDVHKLNNLPEDPTKQEYFARYLNRRLLVIIEAYCRLRHSNWQFFETSIERLLEVGSLDSQRGQPPNLESKERLAMKSQLLDFAEKQIQAYSVEQITYDCFFTDHLR